MKLKAIALLTCLVAAANSHAALTSTLNTDGSLTLKSAESTSPVKVKYNVDKDSPFIKSNKTYDFQIYRVESKDKLVNTTGVYDNNSPLLKIDGDLVSTSRVLGSPVASMSIQRETPYIKSSSTTVIKADSLAKTKVSGKSVENPNGAKLFSTKADEDVTVSTIVPGSIKSGLDFSAFETGKDIYHIDLSAVRLNEIKDFSTGGEHIGLPSTTSWSSSQKLYIPVGKTARINSPTYNVDGKDYQDVYLISAN